MSYRKFAILFIKYGPAILALACALKVYLLDRTGVYDYNTEEIIVKYINSCLGMFLCIGFYILGRVFHLCWKHRSLCRTALFGNIGYTVLFLMLHIDKSIMLPITIAYVILVIILCLTYRHL